MKRVVPEVYLVAETRVVEPGLAAYLDAIGVPDWTTDAPSDAEKLVEVMGRGCYRSFAPGLNKNVTRVREGNRGYIENILNSAHGSVLEHASTSFIFHNVSRVFTHELVRHRVGVGISQESLRFVRLDDLPFWMPTVIAETPEAMTIFSRVIEDAERAQRELAKLFKLDDERECDKCQGTGKIDVGEVELRTCGSCNGKKAVPLVPFSVKKEITSAMRRIAPDGLGTMIGWTGNFRTIRFTLEKRTAVDAEEEIRMVFGKVGHMVMDRYPNAFQDFAIEHVNGHPQFTPKNKKV